MTQRIDDLLVRASLDAAPYTAGAERVAAANAKMAASAKNTESAVETTEKKLKIFASTEERLMRQVSTSTENAMARVQKAVQRATAAFEAGKIAPEKYSEFMHRANTRMAQLTPRANAATGAIKLQTHQIGNLNQQLIDIGVQLQGGQNPFTIMTQQGPQVIYAVGGMRNAVALLGQALTGTIGLIAGGVAVVAGLGTAVFLAGSRISEMESEARDFNTVIRAMGNDARVTAGQLSGLVDAMRLDGVGESDARAAILAAERRFPGVTGAARTASARLAGDFAAATGGSVEDAVSTFYEISARGVPAIEKLQEKIHLLSAEQLESIRVMGEHGQSAQAVEMVYEMLGRRFDGVRNDNLTPMGTALDELSNAWLGFKTGLADSAFGSVAIASVDALAASLRGLAAALGYVDTEDKLQNLYLQIDALEKKASSGAYSSIGKFANADRSEISRLKDEVARLLDEKERLQRGVPAGEIQPGGDRREQQAFLLEQNRLREREVELLGMGREHQALGRAEDAAAAEAKKNNLNEEETLQLRILNVRVELAKQAAAAEGNTKKTGTQSQKIDQDAIRAARELADMKDRGLDHFRDSVKLESAAIALAERRGRLVSDYADAAGEEVRLAELTRREREVELQVLGQVAVAKRLGNELSNDELIAIRQQAEARGDALDQIDKAQRQMEESARFIPDAFDQAFDRVGNAATEAFARGERGLIDMGNLGRAILADLAGSFLQLSLLNPAKNFLFGGSAATLGSVASGGGGGALGLAANGASLANFFSGGSLSAGIGAKLFGTGAVGAFGPQVPTAGLLGSGGLGVGSILPVAGAGLAALGIARAAGIIGPKPTVGANAGGFLSESGGQFSIGGIGEDRNKGVSQLAAVQAVLGGSLSAINNFVTGAGLLDQQIGEGVREAVQLFASGKNPINITVESLTKAMIPYVEGLTDAQRATIAASQGLDGLQQVLTEIAEQRAFPGFVADLLLQKTDPQKYAQKILTAEIEGYRLRAQAANDNGVTLANIEKIYQLELADIQKQFAGGVGDAISRALESALVVQGVAFDRVDQAFRVLNKSVAAERDTITVAFNERLKASRSALDEVTKSVQRIQGVANSLRSALGGLDVPGQESAARLSAQLQLRGFLAGARTGAGLPDGQDLDDVLRTLQKPSEGLFATFLDYQRDFITTKNDISSLAEIAEREKAFGVSQSDLLQAQIDQDQIAYDNEVARLDGILSSSQAQIDEIRGTTVAVMGVEAAVRSLAFALQAAGTARAAAQAADPVNSLFGALLGRQADTGGAAHFNQALASGQSTVDVAQNIIRSPEFTSTAAPSGIAGLYQTLLGRAPDASGLAYWVAQQAAGQSLQEIALNFTRGQEYADLVAVRGYAHGGYHPGGLRVVGERGPELEFTGPSRIFSNSQSAAMLDNSAIVAELKQSRAEINALMIAVAKSTAFVEYVNRKWDNDGMPPVRAAA